VSGTTFAARLTVVPTLCLCDTLLSLSLLYSDVRALFFYHQVGVVVCHRPSVIQVDVRCSVSEWVLTCGYCASVGTEWDDSCCSGVWLNTCM